VTAFGADYSARELSLAELEQYNRDNPATPISFLIRYIGWPDNPKCISYYPGALRGFMDAGVLVLLFVQNGLDDYLGGRAGGRAAAQRALDDARREGYPEYLPFIFACDRYLRDGRRTPISDQAALEYLRGAAEVVGVERVWSYGFYDLQDLVTAHAGTVSGHVLCGAEDTARGLTRIYQWNNGRIYPGGMESDLLKAFVDLSQFEGDNGVSVQDVTESWYGPRFRGPRNYAEVIHNIEDLATISNAKLDGLTNVLGALSNDRDLTPDAVRQMLDESVAKATPALAGQVAAKVAADLRPQLLEVLGEDNAAQADAILAKMSDRLRAVAAPAEVTA
jgi:hypothetical protein